MKKKILLGVLTLSICLTLTGCQSCTRSLGGTTKITLEPGEKLNMITWRNDSLWYLTRPMREGETAEVWTYEESSDYGFEGKVIIIEQNK